jgi:hypothetical protein
MTAEQVKELEEKILSEEKEVYELDKEIFEGASSVDEVMVLTYVITENICSESVEGEEINEVIRIAKDFQKELEGKFYTPITLDVETRYEGYDCQYTTDVRFRTLVYKLAKTEAINKIAKRRFINEVSKQLKPENESVKVDVDSKNLKLFIDNVITWEVLQQLTYN